MPINYKIIIYCFIYIAGGIKVDKPFNLRIFFPF